LKAPGSGLLKVSSVIYIIWGGIFTVLYLLALLGVGALTAIIGGVSTGVAAVTGGVLGFMVILSLAGHVITFIIGILGMKKADDPGQANFFIVTGFIIGIIQLIALISSFGFITFIALILSLLYIIGGFMNKNAARD